VSHALTWLDVFTSVPLAGNALCVVHEADDIDADTMLAIARETRLSETTFVQTATQDGADYRNRIFTTAGELPFAGHPSLGTAVAIARARGASTVTYVQQTFSGLQPVDVTMDGALARASMLQNPPVHLTEPEPARVLAAAGLGAGDAHPDWPPQVVSTGIPHVIAPVAGDALGRARAHPDLLPELLAELGTTCGFLARVDAAEGAARTRSFFMGDAGVQEDPATGSAAGPLLAYLARRAGITELSVAQGAEMGRPSVLHAAVDGDRVRVSGEVVVVAEGRTSVQLTRKSLSAG
jgi:trans-2,3-dihydro-3-hydroxyanthranilate isomerase